jgi:O-antigen/teichoic acid export membrane protein
MKLFLKIFNKHKDLFLYQFAIGYNAIINLLAIIVFTRIMSANDLGLYFYLIAIINFLSIITAFGFQQGILRYNPGRKSKNDSTLIILYSNFLIVFVTIIFLLVLLLSFNQLIDIEIKLLVLIYIGLIVDSVYKIILSFYQAKKLVNDYKLATIIASNFRWIFGFFLVYFFEFDYLGLVGSFILGEFICILLFFHKEALSIGLYFTRYGFKKVKLYMKYGVPLIGYSLITFLKPLLINFWIKINEGEAAIGIFNANFIMGLNVIGLLTTPFLLYMQPIMVEKFHISQSNFFKYLKLFFRLFTFSSLIILLTFIIFQERIIEILIGIEFRSGGILILFGVFSAVLNGLILILIKPYEMWKKTNSIMKLNFASFFVFITLGYFMHLKYSLEGIAYAYILSNLVTSIYLYFLFRTEIQFDRQIIVDLICLFICITTSILIYNVINVEQSFHFLQIGSIVILVIYTLTNYKDLRRLWLEQKKY